VVSLVAGHLAGLKGTISKSELPKIVPTIKGSQGVDGKQHSNDRHIREEGSWVFKDENLSVHLIRNAFGGGDEMAFRRSLSIPSPHSRKYRDDVTVTVVCWEDGKEAEAKIISENIKVKL
jgi:pyruvate dehydrogenase phosphatase